MIWQVHDEIVIEVHKSRQRQAISMLRECMERAWDLRVPLAVQLREGRSWGEMSVLNEIGTDSIQFSLR